MKIDAIVQWQIISFIRQHVHHLKTFQDDSCLKMMNAVAGENDVQTLTITHLKMHLNAEHNAF